VSAGDERAAAPTTNQRGETIMAGKIGVTTARVAARESFIEKVGPHAPKVMLAACAFGLLAMFLPAVRVTILEPSQSVAVWRDWRGKLALLGYIGVAVMAVMMLKHAMASRKQVIACAATAGVVLLTALWLPLSITTAGLGSAVSLGIGVYVNILAAVAMATGAAIQVKQSKLF
jgi:hypothetical protein